MASKLPLFLQFPVAPSPEPKRSRFNSRQTIVTTTTSDLTRQTFLLANNKISFLSPVIKTNNPTCPVRSVVCTVRSNLNLNFPLISPTDQWGTWTVLFVTGTLGIWSERTKIGRTLGSGSVSTLLGLAVSNLGIISYESPAYSIVLNFLFPLTVPLLLFRADLRRVIKSTGTLLLAFLLGSVATIVGTGLAYMMVPMQTLSDKDSWIMAHSLMAGRFGGAVNYIDISKAHGASPSVVAAGLAAHNVSSAVYFAASFAFASKIPPDESSTSTSDTEMDGRSDQSAGNELPVLQIVTALAMSFAICKLADSCVTKFIGIPGFILPAIAVTAIFLATAFSKVSNSIHLSPSFEAWAMILMQVLFASFGAKGDIWNVINTAPNVLIFSLVQIAIHLALILGFGKFFHFDRKQLLIASNANIGCPISASGMAAVKGWSSLVAPAIFASYFGIASILFIRFVVLIAQLIHLFSNAPLWMYVMASPLVLYEKLLSLIIR